jgi:hypothetical protein
MRSYAAQLRTYRRTLTESKPLKKTFLVGSFYKKRLDNAALSTRIVSACYPSLA